MLAALGRCGATISPALAAPANRSFAAQNRASRPALQSLFDLRTDRSTASRGPLDILTGGVHGLDFLGETFEGSACLKRYTPRSVAVPVRPAFCVCALFPLPEITSE